MSSQLFKRSADTMFCEVGDDIVALNLHRGQCYGMEKVTATVWTLLADPIDVPGICGKLIDLYDVEPDVCHREIADLIEQFRKEGLVEAVT